jgi:integrase
MRSIHRLTSLKVKSLLKRPGMYCDGGGLWLCVSSAAAASWLFRYAAPAEFLGKDKRGNPELKLAGAARAMGLGSARTMESSKSQEKDEHSLAAARSAAAEARKLLRDKIDPLEQRALMAAAKRTEAARAMTFRQSAEAYIEAKRAGWKNAKHAAQWSSTLSTYVYPLLGSLPVRAVDTELVTKVLEPIWNNKPDTASRVRGRIEAILNYAGTRKWREGENPARWSGHLENLFPNRSKVRKVKHHAALPFSQMPSFMAALVHQAGEGARALRFAILTAARTGEVIGATWGEIDLDAALWTIPADRMKAGREHRVPLSPSALALLGATSTKTDFLFTGGRKGRPLSNMALLATLRRMKCDGLTAHGFRSTFRDWAAERMNVDPYIAEMALAHTSGKVEAAYRRGDLFDKRRSLMDAWDRYCSGAEQGDVIPIRREAA